MKKTFLLLFAVALWLNPAVSRAALEGDRDIPISKFTPQQAIEKVSKYYGESKGDPECFIISVTYGRPDRMDAVLVNNHVLKDREEWSWFVTFTHPRKGESTVVYRLRDNGEIYPLMQTRT